MIRPTNPPMATPARLSRRRTARAGLVAATLGHRARHFGSCTLLANLPGATHLDVMFPWPAGVVADWAQTQARGADTNPAFDGRQRGEAYARVVQFHRQHLAAP